MKNPYTILGISQDANNAEIMKAQMIAMKKKEFSLHEIALSVKQLLDPAKRLAADFMFPSNIKVKRIKPIQSSLTYIETDLNSLNENAFDSLN